MNTFVKTLITAGGLMGIALSASTVAQAVSLNTSVYFGSSALTGTAANSVDSFSTMVGGDLTVDFGTYVQMGVFYDHNFIDYTDGGDGGLHFYGGLLRVGLLGHGSNLYIDTKLGLSQRTGGVFTSEHGVGLGAGIGYRIWLTAYLDLSPRLGFRVLPEPFQGTRTSMTTVDGNLLLTFEF